MNNPFRRIALIAISSNLVGCASAYRPLAGAPTASFQAAAETSGGIGMTNYVWSGANSPDCEAGPRGTFLANKWATGEQPMTPAVAVTAAEKLQFTLQYSSSYLGQLKHCRVTGIFTPEAGRSYKAIVKVAPGVSSCDLAVLRLDGEQQTPVDDLDMPQYACNKDTRNGPQLNGQSMQRIYKIERVDLPR